MPPKDNEIITGVVIVVIVFLVAAFFILTLVTFYNRRKKKFMQEKDALQNKFRQELMVTQLEIQEQTFRNISQEIHDNIGQALSFIKLNINMIDLDKREITESKLEESKKLLTKAIQDLRDLAKMLNTDFINETGLPGAIEQQLNILQKTGIYETELIVSGNPQKYNLQRELVCFRIVQELLNNIVKHAIATTIKIDMYYSADKLLITVKDNGKGFIPSDKSEGVGLRNISNRANLINADVYIDSKEKSGTSVTIELLNGVA